MSLVIRPSINRRAAIYAGVAAGIIATAVQIILWWACWDVLPWILYRDARLAAAIVVGSGVLPPPATFDWAVMSVAILIHVALSITYSVILAQFISRCGMPVAVLVGVWYGLALFGVNMYGFTMLFPWFAEARDWITLVAHAVFGGSCAGVYKALHPRG